jgi:hypothetical protein
MDGVEENKFAYTLDEAKGDQSMFQRSLKGGNKMN